MALLYRGRSQAFRCWVFGREVFSDYGPRGEDPALSRWRSLPYRVILELSEGSRSRAKGIRRPPFTKARSFNTLRSFQDDECAGGVFNH